MSLITVRQIVAAFIFGSPFGAVSIYMFDRSLDNPTSPIPLVVGAVAASMIICGLLMIRNAGHRVHRSDASRDDSSPPSR